jgi:hypothetical protein
MNGRTGVILHWLEDFERWVVAIDSDDGETDSEIKRPPLVPVGGQFATALDALPPAVSTTIADGEGPPGAGDAAGSALPVAIATLEGVRQSPSDALARWTAALSVAPDRTGAP